MRNNSSHHESHTRLHNIWCDMNKRCKSNPRYAGRGIFVCDEWKDYSAFASWARSNGYSDELTIERINVNGPYEPNNCKWITLEKQARNRTTTRWVMYGGEKMSLAEASERSGIPYKVAHLRIKSGWSVEKALSVPVRSKSELHKKCDELGLNYHTVYNRIRMGWTEDEALKTRFAGIGANQTTY